MTPGVFEGRFAGRVAVVTGGASGLGRDIGTRILAEGGRVSLWDINGDGLANVVKAIGAHHTATVDIADYSSVAAAATSTFAQFGRILAALGAGRHSDAYEAAERLLDPASPAHHPVIACWLIGDLA